MTKEQLEQEHKKLVKQLHPDRNPNNPNATAEFQEMQQQYEERLAELNGDYTKANKGRARREREERERQERERQEKTRRKVEEVIEQARRNRNLSHRDLKHGDYIYVRQLKGDAMPLARSEYLLREVLTTGVNDETIVVIETIVELTDDTILCDELNSLLPDGVWGGYEVLQKADPKAGIRKGKRVAKVVMFRSPNYCFFGNPMGDMVMSYFYMPSGFGTMFKKHLEILVGRIGEERKAAERKAAERKAKMLAEQQPVIDEWHDKLIEISGGLTDKEKREVAIDNLKKMLKAKFPGVTFRFKDYKDPSGWFDIHWEDGPTVADVDVLQELFDPAAKYENELTPWEEKYGHLYISGFDRKMSTLAKAKILQQLGQVTDAFRSGAMSDDVEVSDFDWIMLHAMVGIDINSVEDHKLCLSRLSPEGIRMVNILTAVRYIFDHTSYAKTKASKKKAA